MNVPLKWLAEYVKLPKETKTLTDKLTSIGHMLDKTFVKDGETVIDLELRGNRADMFGLVGGAREVAAITGAKLKLPPVTPLPQVDKNSPLITVQPSAVGLVYRYTAVKMQVAVKPSPAWLVNRLASYSIPAVNNIVDITNFVMVETGHPLHAFDYSKIKGGQLILRRAKNGEKFATVQQGISLTLSDQDLVIADTDKVHGLTVIGGWDSKISASTSHLILESAVYNPASSRRTARRLKTITEAGNRHEKHQDPNGVAWALSRAVYLLTQVASAKVEGLTSDYYPHPVTAKTIDFDIAEIARLTGLEVKRSQVNKILASLEFQYQGRQIIVPTFRTDVEESADIVEEITRVVGYDQIPATPIADAISVPQTYPSFAIGEKLRDVFTRLGLNEVITLSMAQEGEVKLVNPPEQNLGYLRSSISPSLVKYVLKLVNLRQEKVAIFEIGKIFTQTGSKYTEHLHLGLAVTQFADLTGVLQKAAALLGVDHLSARVGETNGIYWAEIDVDKLLPLLPDYVNPYAVVSAFPPIIEDVNVTYQGNYFDLIKRIKKISPLINQIELIDKYDDKLTLRMTYHSATKQLSSSDIAPLRMKITESVG